MTGGISLGRIVAEITANTAGLRRGAADAERILNDTSNNASAAGKAIGVAFAVTAALGVMKLIDKLEDCTQVAIDNKKALMGLESVAKAYGVSVEDATKATKDFTQDGLLQMKSATTGMKNILSTGFNITEAMNLSKALKDIGAFNNVTGDLGQAFEDATKGMRTGSIELIENIGLTQKLSAVMKAANIDISNGIDLTNNAAQREAFYNMVLKEGEKFKGNAAKLAESQASSQEKANAAMKEAADAIGNRLLPAYSSLMDSVTSLAKETFEIFKITKLEAVTKELNAQQETLNTLQYTYLELKDKVNMTDAEQRMFLKTIDELKKSYPDFLGNIDLQNIKLSSAITLFEELNKQMLNKRINMMQEAEMSDLMDKQIKLRLKEAAAMEKVNSLLANPVGGWRGKYTAINLTNSSQAKAVLDDIRMRLGINAKEIEKTNEKYKKLKENIASNEKTTIYTKPDFLVKLEKDTKEAQRIQAEIDKRNATTATGEKTKAKTTVTVKPEIEITDPEPSWIEVQNLIYGQFAKFKPEINYTINREDAMKSAQDAADLYATQYLEKYKSAQDAADIYAKQFIDQYKGSDLEKLMEHFNNPQFEEVDGTYINKSLEDVTKSFSELAGVLDNEVISAISNIANEAMSMSGSIKGFSAAQGAEDTFGMLSSGIGMFSSAVSIFQIVGGLFSKSTYNFDEAVAKMLKGIGEKTPNIQISEYAKALKISEAFKNAGVTNPKNITSSQYDKLKAAGVNVDKAVSQGSIYYSVSKQDIELVANLKKIIPQLAEQLGTAAADFGSAIGSALSSSATSEELKANLYDSIYGTVKSGLINAFLAGEVMKPLLDKLQETVTLAVADGIMSPEEKAAIQALMGDVGVKTDEFYSALEAVGLNVVDAAGQLNEAANRMDNVNRNLRLADRISTITTQSGTIGIPPLLSGGSVVYDFSNANLGGMTEQQVISAVSKANRMASIKRTGV